MPAPRADVLNAANEIAVAAFLERRIGFNDIAALIERALGDARTDDVASIEECVAVDVETRARVRTLVEGRTA